MTLVDTGAECSLIQGNPQEFSGPLSNTDGYGGQTAMTRKVFLTLQVGGHPTAKNMRFLISSIPENILGIDILQGQLCKPLSVNLSSRLIKPVLKGNTNWEPVNLVPL